MEFGGLRFPLPENKAEAEALTLVKPPRLVKEEAAKLPPLHLTGTRVVPDHLLEKKLCLGG